MAALKQYKVFHKITGKLVFEGTAKECAEEFGVTDGTIRHAASEGHVLIRKYRVVDYSEMKDKNTDNYTGFDAAAKKWDDFCEPIRKKYNIPVYKAKPEVRG